MRCRGRCLLLLLPNRRDTLSVKKHDSYTSCKSLALNINISKMPAVDSDEEDVLLCSVGRVRVWVTVAGLGY